ncbi:MAG: hypothetical protein CVV29_06755 [Methanobacteriales archaeon HGW-Methanobacteriales-2]|jgi:tRNA A-37 threonylcarbamoyl transferase component Bud32|nr:MAG: hypothetical protein CVV29_06755 [Methanobacteriales archaeon HGW-Methanobacteriales-2]
MAFHCQNGRLKILEKFKSFKNQAYKVKTASNNFYVLKIYNKDSKKSNSFVEAINLKKLEFKGVKVPKVLYRSSPDDSEDYLLLEYVPGVTISHLLEEQNGHGDHCIDIEFKKYLKDLGCWVASLHGIQDNTGSFLKGDCNLRNFIWTGSEICGLDFEETKIGDPREDLGEICFFLLTNSPPLTSLRLEMVDWFLKSYEKSSETKIRNISDFIAKSAREAYRRRQNFNRV